MKMMINIVIKIIMINIVYNVMNKCFEMKNYEVMKIIKIKVEEIPPQKLILLLILLYIFGLYVLLHF